jgi:hypothetical protein
LSFNPIPPFVLVNSTQISTHFKECGEYWFNYLIENKKEINLMISADNWESCLEFE